MGQKLEIRGKIYTDRFSQKSAKPPSSIIKTITKTIDSIVFFLHCSTHIETHLGKTIQIDTTNVTPIPIAKTNWAAAYEKPKILLCIERSWTR